MNILSRKFIPFILVIFIGGACIGWYSRYFYATHIRIPAPLPSNSSLRQNSAYPLISPLLACDFSATNSSRSYERLRVIIQKVLDARETSDNITDASVYFRNLRTGDWTGINENEQYTPASLLKIPVMIAYFKKAEQDPTLLHKQILYNIGSASGNIPQTIAPPEALQPNNYYTVGELIKRMIIDSDNAPEILLTDNLDPTYIGEVLTDLGLNPDIFHEEKNSM